MNRREIDEKLIRKEELIFDTDLLEHHDEELIDANRRKILSPLPHTRIQHYFKRKKG